MVWRTASSYPAEQILMAENHAGSNVPRLLATGAFFTEMAVTSLFFLRAFMGISWRFADDPPPSGRRQQAAKLRPATTS